jgi:hypothetical protein
VYIFTLKAATAKMLSEIPAAAQAAVGAAGMAAVTSESRLASRHTRKRPRGGGAPRRMKRSESQPPANPPSMATSGGIQAYQAACATVRWCTSTRYCVVQLVHSE